MSLLLLKLHTRSTEGLSHGVKVFSLGNAGKPVQVKPAPVSPLKRSISFYNSSLKPSNCAVLSGSVKELEIEYRVITGIDRCQLDIWFAPWLLRNKNSESTTHISYSLVVSQHMWYQRPVFIKRSECCCHYRFYFYLSHNHSRPTKEQRGPTWLNVTKQNGKQHSLFCFSSWFLVMPGAQICPFGGANPLGAACLVLPAQLALTSRASHTWRGNWGRFFLQLAKRVVLQSALKRSSLLVLSQQARITRL